jgi:hypothetical protein
MREYSEETDRRIFVDVTWDIYCTADIYWFAPFCFTSQEKGNFWFFLIFSLIEKKNVSRETVRTERVRRNREKKKWRIKR